MCENDYFLQPHVGKILGEARATVARVYSSIYSVINVEYMAKISGMKTEEASTVAMEWVKDRGMKPTVSEDKKSITVTRVEQNVNKRIVEKGHELEERTRKLQDFISHKPESAVVA